eukprot:jgi/Mesvir1/23924/Mv10700-RA.2
MSLRAACYVWQCSVPTLLGINLGSRQALLQTLAVKPAHPTANKVGLKLRHLRSYDLASFHHKGTVTSACHRPVVFTSEFWYEEEEEFDVLEIIRPKRIQLVRTWIKEAKESPWDGLTISSEDTLEYNVQSVADQLNSSRLVFQACFCGPQDSARQICDVLWKGQDGPPYFRKVKLRDTLAAPPAHPGKKVVVVDDKEGPKNGAEEFLNELITCNWMSELRDGLGQSADDVEDVLVVIDGIARIQFLSRALDLPLEEILARGLVSPPLVTLHYTGKDTTGSYPDRDGRFMLVQ